MINFKTGNLLESDAQALVNTVNEVGVMGKGIALMFKEAFPENNAAYEAACRKEEVRVGKMFVFASQSLFGPRWIINFPTKRHWRHRSKMEWIVDGLADLKEVIRRYKIDSIAVPPLGCGNGGLQWSAVRPVIEQMLGGLEISIDVYEPTSVYQNVAQKVGKSNLTSARAVVVELVRRYSLLGIECSLLEAQKLLWFADRILRKNSGSDPLKLEFEANRYGPYSDPLRHLMTSLQGSYLQCDKHLADASAFETIWFDNSKADEVDRFISTSLEPSFKVAIETTSKLIEGFESPLGMELLATLDWLIFVQGFEPRLASIKEGLKRWAGGPGAAERKENIFEDYAMDIALLRLREWRDWDLPAQSS